MRSLSEEGIGTQVHYIPVHRQPYYRDRFKDCREMFRNAEHYYQGCLTLPCYPSLQDEDIERVISAVKKYVS
jgi:dTDP-4-amino-4,6-dideoxygalactose transaminase